MDCPEKHDCRIYLVMNFQILLLTLLFLSPFTKNVNNI